LFADSAVKKYIEWRDRASAPPARPRPGSQRLVSAAAIGLLAAAIIGLWALLRHPDIAPAPATTAANPAAGRSALAASADAALAADRLTSPSGDGALELYREALARDPNDSAARAGLADVRERLWSRADRALLEEHLDAAASAIETARQAGVDGGRVALLAAQLAALRERLKGPPAQQRVVAARTDQESVSRLLSLTEARIKDGRLDADGDGALSYFQQAERLDPRGKSVQATRQSLATALLADAGRAIDRHEFAQAARSLDAAVGIAAADDIENMRRLLRAAPQRAAAEAAAANAVVAADAAAADAAAKGAQTPPTEPQPVRQEAATAEAGESQAAVGGRPIVRNRIAASELTLLKSVKPVYPVGAQREKTEGWVELDFTVATGGEVKDIEVHAADPAKIFENAAVRALAQWRYKSVLYDGEPVEQPARVRIRFALAE
jgi:protein TonB